MGERHNWTPDDDARLEEAVLTVATCGVPPRVEVWSAVCGRLAPDLLVTPDAARSRYRRIVARRRDEAAEAAQAIPETSEEDAWERTMVEEHEQSQVDRIESMLVEQGERIARIEELCEQLRRMWV